MALPPVVALEIGTSKIIALVGEMREDACVMITGMGEHESVGVRKGEIIDFENAVTCVRAVLGAAEESGKVAIRSVHLAVSGGLIQSVVNRGMVPVLDKNGEITRDDIEEVMDVARAVNLPSDRDILHTICQHFCVDGQERVVKPEGMEGAQLSLDMLVLHVVRNRLRNTVRVVRSVPVDVEDAAFGGLCSALAVLTPEQKKSGVIVIDLGGGTTDYLAYAGNVVAAAGSIGVGGEHVTNDIMVGFGIPTARAEKLKCETGSALIENGNGSKRISLPAEVGFSGRTISVRSLDTIINARMEETLEMVRRRMEDLGILHQAGAGVVLTGGGAHMRGVARLTEEVFGLTCSIGKPRNVSGIATATEGPEYAACTGMVQYGFKTLVEQRRASGLGGWLKGIFGR